MGELSTTFTSSISEAKLQELTRLPDQAAYRNNAILLNMNNLLLQSAFSQTLSDRWSVSTVAKLVDEKLRKGHFVQVCSSDSTIIQPGTYINDDGIEVSAIITPLFLIRDVFRTPTEMLQQYAETAYLLTKYAHYNSGIDFKEREDASERSLGRKLVYPPAVQDQLDEYRIAVIHGLSELRYQLEPTIPLPEPQRFW
ncbi:TPA: hypothetical protein DIV55_00915 [Patescibacteria group bacterium]|uniref:Uncharacterized protein n=1 Tax=Candidatus Gottesmanbacteria bacterium GW2011_GWA1_43_11 TaxID=1618436 RepID=A0A0G1EP82_9BACT|nr:MAG: hypothetical protein UV59_C0013G0014 [Candidatus Gottesmanbacteria bacterium GW2011_GWA1_43_11]HCS78284.1 hypothetical protein [Patescibacteria group bacterium]